MALGSLKGPFGGGGFTFIEVIDAEGNIERVFMHITHVADGADPSAFVRGASVEFDLETVEHRGQTASQARRARLVRAGEPAAGDRRR